LDYRHRSIDPKSSTKSRLAGVDPFSEVFALAPAHRCSIIARLPRILR
jgi:hypothetical protein